MSKSTMSLRAGRPSARGSKSKAATLASLSEDAGVMKRVNFEISEELHTRLKLHSLKTGKSIKALVTDFIRSLPEEK